MARWFEQQRMEWIAETLRVFGFINRARYIVGDDGVRRRTPKKLRGKAAVKAAKRARVYNERGERVIRVIL